MSIIGPKKMNNTNPMCAWASPNTYWLGKWVVKENEVGNIFLLPLIKTFVDLLAYVV
jgi:hypothetical protein